MTQALFLETQRKEERLKEEGERRLNVSGVLRILGVSRSGYIAFRKHLPSDCQIKKEQRMKEIKAIHEESHGIYGAPKIAAKMRRDFHPGSPNAAWCTDITYIWTGEGFVYLASSYLAKACPWDNACIESFHSLIKREWISRFQIAIKLT